jgi:hypothetical protein
MISVSRGRSRAVTIAFAVVWGTACAVPRGAARAPLEETAIFAAVLESARQEGRDAILEVTLQPLADDPEGTRTQALDAAALAALRTQRRAVLAGTPWREVADAVSNACPGRLPGADTRGCPTSLTYRYAVGLSRPGGVRVKPGPSDPSLRTVRVGETTLNSSGASWATYDIVLARRGAEWQVVARHTLDVIP